MRVYVHDVYVYVCVNSTESLMNATSLILQNQFFISSLPEDNVINDIAERLRLRIARAYKEKKKFRVIVVMPLLPSFEGNQ